VDDEVGDEGEAGSPADAVSDSDSLTLPPTPLPPPPPPPPPPPQQQQAPPTAGGGIPRAAAAAGAALAVALGVFALWRAVRGRRRREQRPAEPDYGALVAAVSVPGGLTAGAAAPSPSGASHSAALPLAGTTVVLSGLCAPRAGTAAACLHLCACQLSGACAYLRCAVLSPACGLPLTPGAVVWTAARLLSVQPPHISHGRCLHTVGPQRRCWEARAAEVHADGSTWAATPRGASPDGWLLRRVAHTADPRRPGRPTAWPAPPVRQAMQPPALKRAARAQV